MHCFRAKPAAFAFLMKCVMGLAAKRSHSRRENASIVPVDVFAHMSAGLMPLIIFLYTPLIFPCRIVMPAHLS
jgi:hypothetical protein